MIRIIFLLLSMLCLNAGHAFAQQSDTLGIVTDRPDETESAMVIPQNHLQIETGTKFSWISEQEREFQYNNLLLRYGVLPWLEFRLAQVIGRQQLSLEGAEYEYKGFYPLALGTKVELLQEQNLLPQFALLYHVTLPGTGSSEFQQQEATHAVRALFSYTLTDWLSLGYNIGMNFPAQEEEARGIYTFSLAFVLSKRLGAFTEVYGDLERSAGNRHAFDGGFTYLLRNNLQLDASAGFGLNQEANNGFVSAGVSWRLPR